MDWLYVLLFHTQQPVVYCASSLFTTAGLMVVRPTLYKYLLDLDGGSVDNNNAVVVIAVVVV